MGLHGKEKLWNWFGLGRASWLTLPRVLMHEMPGEWQAKMADLLNEYENTYQNLPSIGTGVTIYTLKGKKTKEHDYLKDYHNPDLERIDKLKTGGFPPTPCGNDGVEVLCAPY